MSEQHAANAPNAVMAFIKKLSLSQKTIRTVFITVLIGVPLSFLLAWHLLQLENLKENSDYEMQASQIMSAIEQQLRSDENILMSASFFLNVESDTSPDTFVQFMTPYLVLRPEIDSFTWISYVSKPDLEAFRAKADRVFPGYKTHGMSSEDISQSSDHYFVYFQHPIADLRGLDLTGIPFVLKTILRAKKENSITSLPSSLRDAVRQNTPVKKVDTNVMELFYPVYHKGNTFAGVISITLNIDEVITVIAANSSFGNMQVMMRKASDSTQSSDNNERRDNISNDFLQLRTERIISGTRSLKIGDATREIVFSSTNNVPWLKQHKIVLSVLLASLGITALIAVYWVNMFRLAEAKSHAEQASRTKSAFLANMSHEIRTPMNGVLGMIEQVLDTELQKQQVDLLEIAHSSAESLLEIINDILDISKIEAGKLAIEKVSYDLHALIEMVTDLLYLRASDKKLALIVDIDLELPRYILGDPIRIRQIIMNLVGNGLKFTDKGHVTINVQYEKTAPPQLRFEVADTGIGIAEHKLSRIFREFSQEEESTTRRFGGTGLGLSISKKLVEMMGGQIGVRSTMGKGSVFWFTLPMVIDTAKQYNIAKVPDDITNARVILIKNYQPSQQQILKYFTSWGMHCDVAADTKTAFMAFSNASVIDASYRFVLIDAELPGWLSLLEYLSPETTSGKIQVILIVPPTMPIDEYVLKSKGITGVLSKPLYPSHLFDMLLYLWQHNPQDLTELVTKRTLASSKGELVKPLTNRQLVSKIDFSGTKILLVDDQPVNRQLMKLILDKIKCQTDMANNGVEAVEKVKEKDYDIVFMDCHMPEMDGYEATREIRKFEKVLRKHTPVVALTADAMQGTKEICLASGMDDYINKPVKPVNIHDMLQKYVTTRQPDS